MTLKMTLLRMFTWWNGANFNTMRHTRVHGELVGYDEFGNAYYRTKGGAIDPSLGFQRRWVIYAGESEASGVPPGWFGWLHHTYDLPPTQDAYTPHAWEAPHRANPTGTAGAWRPKGSTLRQGPRQSSGGDYEAWTPS